MKSHEFQRKSPEEQARFNTQVEESFQEAQGALANVDYSLALQRSHEALEKMSRNAETPQDSRPVRLWLWGGSRVYGGRARREIVTTRSAWRRPGRWRRSAQIRPFAANRGSRWLWRRRGSWERRVNSRAIRNDFRPPVGRSLSVYS